MSEDNKISMDMFFTPPTAEEETQTPSETPTAPICKLCKVCNLELGFLELQARLQYHWDCCKCEHCQHDISKEIMLRWINDKGPRAHSTCHDTYMQAEMAKRPVTITQGLLDYLNGWRLCPDMTRTVEENQSRASVQTRKNAIDMNHEELFVFMKMAQAVSATISVIVAENKDASAVKLRREAFDIEREKRTKDLVADAHDVRLSQQAQVEKKRDKKLLSKQTPEGKLLNDFLKMPGMTLEMAKNLLATAHKKAKENIQ